MNVWIEIAETIAQKSKDPSTKVGAVIVDAQNRIVSTGYNGMIAGVREEYMWNGGREKKLMCVIHAEMNALLFAKRNDLTGSTMYCTHQPCENCLKHAMQVGIRHFYFKHHYGKFTEAQREAMTELILASGSNVEAI